MKHTLSTIASALVIGTLFLGCVSGVTSSVSTDNGGSSSGGSGGNTPSYTSTQLNPNNPLSGNIQPKSEEVEYPTQNLMLSNDILYDKKTVNLLNFN